MTPTILLCGKAGSGKDSVAEILARRHGTTSIAMADPMKRLAKVVFGFTDYQLWGPSSSRNAPDPRFFPDSQALKDAHWEIQEYGPTWLDAMGRHQIYMEELNTWASGLFLRVNNGDPLSPRTVLQTLGTEFGRAALGDNVWVDQALRVAGDLLAGRMYDRTKGPTKPAKPWSAVVITDGRFPNEVLRVKVNGGMVVKVVDPDGEAGSAAAQAGGIQGHASETSQDLIPDAWFDAILVNRKIGLDALEVAVSGLFQHLFPTRHFTTQLMPPRRQE